MNSRNKIMVSKEQLNLLRNSAFREIKPIFVPGNIYFFNKNFDFDNRIYSSIAGNAEFVGILFSGEPFFLLEYQQTDDIKEVIIDAKVMQGTNLGWIKFYYDFFENQEKVFGIWKLE